jgi:hypothetical protein
LLVTTFIPPGRHTSYKAIQNWVDNVRGISLDISTVSIALSDGMRYLTVNNISVHRVIEENCNGRKEGHGKIPPCQWGYQISGSNIHNCYAMLESGGVNIREHGPILGSTLEFREVGVEMAGTTVEKFINNHLAANSDGSSGFEAEDHSMSI